MGNPRSERKRASSRKSSRVTLRKILFLSLFPSLSLSSSLLFIFLLLFFYFLFSLSSSFFHFLFSLSVSFSSFLFSVSSFSFLFSLPPTSPLFLFFIFSSFFFFSYFLFCLSVSFFLLLLLSVSHFSFPFSLSPSLPSFLFSLFFSFLLSIISSQLFREKVHHCNGKRVVAAKVTLDTKKVDKRRPFRSSFRTRLSGNEKSTCEARDTGRLCAVRHTCAIKTRVTRASYEESCEHLRYRQKPRRDHDYSVREDSRRGGERNKSDGKNYTGVPDSFNPLGHAGTRSYHSFVSRLISINQFVIYSTNVTNVIPLSKLHLC